jgi:hypothetical protein
MSCFRVCQLMYSSIRWFASSSICIELLFRDDDDEEIDDEEIDDEEIDDEEIDDEKIIDEEVDW